MKYGVAGYILQNNLFSQ